VNVAPQERFWRGSVSVRISHPSLDPDSLSVRLNSTPVIAYRPGESKVRHGSCLSAGYWCVEQKAQTPQSPTALFLWLEKFAADREEQLRDIIGMNYRVYAYFGIHTNLLALGFDFPAMPVSGGLGIGLGMEIFTF
jgi:hypothetical protein